MAQAKDIREDILWVIQEQINEKSGGGTDLRVIRWIIDGKPIKPALEKRDWFLSPEGDRKLGKAKGMGAGDLYLIIKNIKAIAKLLEIKPQHLDEALQIAMFQDEKPSSEAKTQAPPSSMSSNPNPGTAAVGATPDINF